MPSVSRRPATTAVTGEARHRSGRRRSHGPAAATALSESERAAILDELHSERFVDMSPTKVMPPARRRPLPRLDPTLYRLLRQAGESRERRRQATHPAKVKPELVAYGPNSVWSWDITKLRGPAKGAGTTCT